MTLTGLDTLQQAESSEEARRLHHISRLYAVLSDVNRAITRKPGRRELIREICRVLVEVGKFRMAWFGAPDADGWIIPEASFGDSHGYLDNVRVSALDIPEGHGPTGSAVREKRSIICGNIPTNPFMHPWRDQAARHGFNSSACFPVVLPEGALAGLTIYSEETDFFSADEVKLLTDIADDIGYALEFITAEKLRSATETALRLNRQDLARTQAIARVGGWTADLNSGMSTNSPEASRINGLPTHPVPWDAYMALIDPRDLPLCRRAWDEAIATGTVYDVEHRITVGGSAKWVHNLAEVEYATDGYPRQVFGIIQDITEQKQAQEALRLTEERFRVIFESATEGIIVAAQLDRYSFLMANPAICALYGYSEEEFLRLSLEDIHPEEALAEVHAAFNAMACGTMRFARDIPCLRRDGTIFYLDVTASPMFLQGQKYLVGFFTDVTEKRVAEQELRRAKDAAEAASRAKTRFLANMSHELRTPMNGVLGMIQLTLHENLTETQRDSLNLALTSGFGLVRILNDILDLSTIEVGKLTLELQPFSLRECVNTVVSLLRPEALRKELYLTVTLGDELPRCVTGDQIRLRQVLTNLLGNAIKFTLKGGVTMQVHPGPQGITFIITDTGIGIPASMQHRLFQPFSQVDDSSTRRHGGTGLGLAISSEIVELMGGSIVCDSIDGVGSTFSFTLTLGTEKTTTAPTAECHPTEPLRTTATTSPRILVVEDEPVNQMLLRLGLGSKNFQVETADNGRDALEKLAEQAYDLILMDIQMPVMNGITATLAIREQERERGGHIPIVAVTAYASSNDKVECLNAGMDDFLTKPVNLDLVVTVISRLLQ
jgi:PAS domain S-box-containing protein